MLVHRCSAGLALLLLTVAAGASAAAEELPSARPTDQSEQCAEYYGCIRYGAWPPEPRTDQQQAETAREIDMAAPGKSADTVGSRDVAGRAHRRVFH